MRALRALGAPLALALFVAAATACGGDGGETGPSYGPPANVSKQPNTDNQTATVGTSIPIPPSVVVRDASGNAVPGATVTFTVTGGGGSVTGATPSTSAQGVATLGSWTLGTTAGPNQLTATVSGVSAVTFAATGTAGPPSAIAKVSGDAQTVKAGTAVPVPPSVRVQDQHGNPVSGAQVTFGVTAGGGTVTGATQTTDANGRAAVASWTLGVSPGVNRLSVSVSGGVPTVEFSAQGLDPCGIAENLPVGNSESESLSPVDCTVEGHYVDFYATAIPAASAFQFTMTSATVDTYLELFTNAGLVAFNDDRPGTLDAGIKALLAADTYFLAASSALANQTGPYTVSRRALPLQSSAASRCGRPKALHPHSRSRQPTASTTQVHTIMT